MFYIKTIVEGEIIEIPIYDDEIFTRCYNCGSEMQADTEMLLNVLTDGDLSSTRVACCDNEKVPLKRIK